MSYPTTGTGIGGTPESYKLTQCPAYETTQQPSQSEDASAHVDVEAAPEIPVTAYPGMMHSQSIMPLPGTVMYSSFGGVPLVSIYDDMWYANTM